MQNGSWRKFKLEVSLSLGLSPGQDAAVVLQLMTIDVIDFSELRLVCAFKMALRKLLPRLALG